MPEAVERSRSHDLVLDRFQRVAFKGSPSKSLTPSQGLLQRVSFKGFPSKGLLQRVSLPCCAVLAGLVGNGIMGDLLTRCAIPPRISLSLFFYLCFSLSLSIFLFLSLSYFMLMSKIRFTILLSRQTCLITSLSAQCLPSLLGFRLVLMGLSQ